VPWRGPCCGGARSPAVRPGLPSSRSVKLASKRRRRQCRAVPGRRSPASGPGRRRDGAPAADRACRGLVVVSGGWQAAVAGVCSCWRCCGQWRAAHRAAPGRRSPASEPGRRPDGTPAADRACRGLVRILGCSITGSASGSSFSRSLKPATKRRRRQRRAAPVRQSPASGPGRRPDGTPAADRACRGLVKVSVCWQASVAGVCQGSRRRGSCWWCCGQGVQLVGQCFRVFVLSIGETCHEATTAPVSNGAWKAIAGKRARATARRRTGSRSGVPWPGRGVGWLASRGCRRVLVLAVLWSVACSSSSSTGKAIAGKRCRDDGETAHRQPIGVAAAWSRCRSAGRHRCVCQGSRRRGPCWWCLITVSCLAYSFWKKISL
jgi:hypothetical protein